MDFFYNFLKRSIPFILALVMVFGKLPAVPSFAAEASSSEGESSAAGTVISSGDVAVLANFTLSGVWVFNDVLSKPSQQLYLSIDFTSNGSSFTNFFVDSSSSNFLLGYGNTVVLLDNVWQSDAYRIVDFGSSPKVVDLEFYNWFTANATKQVGYTYTLKLDGSSVLTYSSSSGTVQLNFEIFNESAFFYFGSDYGNGYDKGYSNDDSQRFAGISKYSTGTQFEYAPGVDGPTYTIDVPCTSPTLNLYSVYEYPLYIDPNGGSWNGSPKTSVFWDLPTVETDEIYDPVRAGYVFSGWSSSGGGEFYDVGDPPYSYKHGTSPGYLTANWVVEEVLSYTHTISIDGCTYNFSGNYSAPPVQIQVFERGISMTSGQTTRTWTYYGSDVFVGIQDSSGNTYDVGSSFSLLGSSGANKTSTLTPLTESPSAEMYTTQIKIYDNSGSTLLHTYSEAATGSCPIITVTPSASGCAFIGKNTDSWIYSGSGSIAGLSNMAGSSEIFVAADKSLQIGGFDGQNFVINLYVVLDETSTPDPEPTYYNTIYIDGVPYQFSGMGSSPDVQLTVQENGCILTSGSTSLTYLYSGTGTFTGLSFVAGTDPNLPIGTVITLDGSNSGDSSIKLYACYEEVLPDQDEEFQGGVLGWLKYLSEKIRDLPGNIAEKMASAALPAPLQFIFSIFDFDSLRTFFVDMYHNVTSVFGLKTLIEDPAGPFAWLMAS